MRPNVVCLTAPIVCRRLIVRNRNRKENVPRLPLLLIIILLLFLLSFSMIVRIMQGGRRILVRILEQ